MVDKLPNSIRQDHVLVILADTLVETANPDVEQTLQRGVYLFTNLKKARRVKSLVNETTDNETAVIFSRTYMETESDEN